MRLIPSLLILRRFPLLLIPNAIPHWILFIFLLTPMQYALSNPGEPITTHITVEELAKAELNVEQARDALEREAEKIRS